MRSECICKHPPFPRRLMIEVTNICNHRCVFCANSKSIRKRGTADIGMVQEVITEAYQLGARELSFHAMGEPLLYKELPKCVQMAKNIGYEYVYIDTNGALAAPDVINPIIDAGIDSIKFSISGATRETYKKMHGRDDYDIVINNIKQVSFYKNNMNKKLKLITDFVKNSNNAYEIEMFEKTMQPLVDEVWSHEVLNQGGNMVEDNKEIGGTTYVTIPCNEVFDRMVVMWNGDVTAYCMDFDSNLVYGNVQEDSLEEVWHNECVTKLREMHLHGRVDGTLCYNCAYSVGTEIQAISNMII